jgi:hypothetical protein
MNKLFCDLKTDEEKAKFFLSGRGYETGVIAHSIQNDVAMAYHRCAEYKKELAALQAEREAMRRCAVKYLEWLGVIHIPLEQALYDDMRNPGMCGNAALAAHRKQGDGQ